MKKLIILSTLITLQAFSFNLKVKSIKLYSDFDAKFDFVSRKKKDYATLDCQSFFQKLDFYRNKKLVSENFISIGECEWLYEKVEYCLEDTGSACLNSEDMWTNSCDC